jgi:hypothetical protein
VNLFEGMSVLNPDALPWPVTALTSLCSAWHFAYMFAFFGQIFERGRSGSKGPFANARTAMWWVEVHLAFPGMLLYWALTIDGLFDAICLVVNAWVWWDWCRNHDGDDRWKKRRKKAVAKVKQVAGRLIVVPIPAPSGA